MTSTVSLRVERALMRDGACYVAGMDEVGRGALAGPVSVGVVVVDASVGAAPEGVRDSKELSAGRREQLVAPIRAWACASAVGHSSPQEIDEWGIVGALRVAGRRALSALLALSEGSPPSSPLVPRMDVDVVLLDGSHDWLSGNGQASLFDERDAADFTARVVTRVKADQSCASVAAASVLAKVERDALMRDLHALHPAYDWESNKGYSSPSHVAALGRHGATSLHRRSWSLPGT